MGGIAFTLGSYAGLLEVLNVAKDNDARMSWVWYSSSQYHMMRRYVSWEAILGYVSYVIGALFFNVNTLLGLCGVESKIWVWGTAAVGSALFVVGGAVESYHNRVHHQCIPHSQAQALSICNTVGALFFLFASLA
eukprot:2724799-Amphidinium_carterae.1